MEWRATATPFPFYTRKEHMVNEVVKPERRPAVVAEHRLKEPTDDRTGDALDQPDVDPETGDERETTEVGHPEGWVEVDKDAYPVQKEADGAVLADVAAAAKPVVTSLDEQRDPDTHKRIAKDSQLALRVRTREKARQDDIYLKGEA